MDKELIEVLQSIAVPIVTLIGIYIKDNLERKKLKAKNDLGADLKVRKSISSILEDVRYEIGADKVQYWVFSNGDITSSGFHLKKMSVFEESSADGMPDIAHQYQLVPAKKFDKNLSMLNESEDETITFKVSELSGDLQDFYSLYGVKEVLKIKVKDNRGKWIGILSAWFTDEKIIDDGKIAFAKIQSSRIGIIK